MKVEISEIIEEVLIRMDESPEILDDYVEYGSPQFDLRELIKNLIPETAVAVVATADLSDLSEWEEMSGEVTTLCIGKQPIRRIFILPEDFCRMVYVRMSDWVECVVETMRDAEATLSLRRHWEGRDGAGTGSPAVSLCRYNGRRGLEIFGSGAGSRVAEGGYLASPSIEGESLRFPPSLKGELIRKLIETINGIRR